jgi:hypothetical protein
MPTVPQTIRGHGRKKPGAWARVDWSHPLARNLAGLWLFNERAGGTAYDLAGRGINGKSINGTLTNSPTWGPSLFQSSGIQLDNASTQYIDLGSATSFMENATPFSLSWWELVLPASGTYPSRFTFAVQNSASTKAFSVFRSSDNSTPPNGGYANLTWGGPNSNFASSAFKTTSAPSLAASVLQWHHYVITGKSGPGSNTTSDYAVYIDGVPGSVVASSGYGGLANSQNRIGYDGADSQPNAVIDHVAIWYNRALSAADVFALYLQPFALVQGRFLSRWVQPPPLTRRPPWFTRRRRPPHVEVRRRKRRWRLDPAARPGTVSAGDALAALLSVFERDSGSAQAGERLSASAFFVERLSAVASVQESGSATAAPLEDL